MATAYRTQVCSRCKRETDDFAPHATLGRQAYCRPCMKEYQAQRRNRNRMLERRSKYGVSIEWQQAQWDAQNGRCGCCSEPLEFLDAHLDHNHESGAPRAFVCEPCNHTLGAARESADRLMAAVAYLLEHQA